MLPATPSSSRNINILRVVFYVGLLFFPLFLMSPLSKIGGSFILIFIIHIILSSVFKEKGMSQTREIIMYRWIAIFLGIVFPIGFSLLLWKALSGINF